MRKSIKTNLISIVLTILSFCTYANNTIDVKANKEFSKAISLVDSLKQYIDGNETEYNLYAKEFNKIDFNVIKDSSFREVIFERTELLRRNYKYNEALDILSNSILVAKNKKDTLSTAYFHKLISTHYYHLDNYDSTSSQLEKAAVLYQYLNDKAELGVIYLRKSRIAYSLGQYRLSIKYSFKAIELHRATDDQKKMAVSYLQLGNVYFYLSNYEEAKKNYELAKLLFKESEYDYGFYEAISNIGLVEITAKEYRKGMNKQFTVLKYLIKEDYAIDKGMTYNNLYSAYFGLQKYDSCIYFVGLAKEEFEKSNYKNGYCQAFLNEANVLFVQEKFEEALTSAKISHEIATENSLREQLVEVNFILYKIYKKLNDESNSYSSLEEYIKLNDSLDFNPLELQGDAMNFQIAAEEAQLKQQIAEDLAEIQLLKKEELKRLFLLAAIVAIIALVLLMISFYFHSRNTKLNKNLALKREQLAEELKLKEALLSEIHHRVKNNLQVISSMLSLQNQYIPDEAMKKIINDCRGRISSMSLIHESLYRKKDYKEVLFSTYIEELIPRLVHTYGVDKNKVNLIMDLEPIQLSIDDSIPCGLIINEITSNSLKHGFSNIENGEISIHLSQKRKSIHLSISDNGVGLKTENGFKSNKSFGFLLIETLAKQLEAELIINTLNGFSYQLKWENKYDPI
jgi:two-component sensor histidine kinase